MRDAAADSQSAAIAALLLALPFVLLNVVVSARIEPLHGWITRLEVHNIGGYGPGFFLLVVLLLLWPIGAFVAVRPLLRERRWRVINLALGGLLLVGFLFVGGTLGEEIYRCDILRVPNCD
jgi:hypothetical protein